MSGSTARPGFSPRVIRGTALGLTLAAAVLFVRSPIARATGTPAIITNGTVTLGVNPEGHLNVDSDTNVSLGDNDGANYVQDGDGNIVLAIPSYEDTTVVGLRLNSTNAESTSPEFQGEGWGIAAYETDTTTLLGTGFAQVGRGVTDIICDSFVADSDSAVSIVHIEDAVGDPLLEVTHDFHPSSTPFLYEITVTIKNVSDQTIVPRYRRVFDWDIEPTPFWEFTSMVGVEGALPGVLEFANNDGFTTPDPDGPQEFDVPGLIIAPVIERSNEDYADAGPDDQGAAFGFLFEPLAPGATRQFFVYYGSSPTTTQTVDALNALNILLYSIAKPTIEAGALNDPNDGDVPDNEQNTFAFGFRQVGEACTFSQCFWPPNHAYWETLTITGFPEGTEIVITSITTDEDPCTTLGAGGKKHIPDAIIDGDGEFRLRIERSGQVNGRVYGVHFTATLADETEITGVRYFCVPHDQSGKKDIEEGCCDCVDDGQEFDATQMDCD